MNTYHAAGMIRRHGQNFTIFLKKRVKFHEYIWNHHHEKSIQISTNTLEMGLENISEVGFIDAVLLILSTHQT